MAELQFPQIQQPDVGNSLLKALQIQALRDEADQRPIKNALYQAQADTAQRKLATQDKVAAYLQGDLAGGAAGGGLTNLADAYAAAGDADTAKKYTDMGKDRTETFLKTLEFGTKTIDMASPDTYRPWRGQVVKMAPGLAALLPETLPDQFATPDGWRDFQQRVKTSGMDAINQIKLQWEQDPRSKLTGDALNMSVSTGRVPTVEEQAAMKQAGASKTAVTVNTGAKPFWEGYGKSAMDDLFKSKETAQAAADAIPALQEAKDAVTAGMFTGAGADWKLKGAKVINALGGNVRPEEIANTEIFGAQMGRQVLGLVKNLGAGSGISNADRDYAAMVAGGNISLDEKSILRLIDIGDRAAKASVIAHNSKAERVMAQPEAKGIPYDLTVKAPAISDPFPKQQVGQFEEGQTARNPQTGQVIIYRNGQWVSK